MDIHDLALHVNGPVRLSLARATGKGGKVNGGGAEELGGAYGLALDNGQVEGRADYLLVDLWWGVRREGGEERGERVLWVRREKGGLKKKKPSGHWFYSLPPPLPFYIH